jgi:hypothetical protein
MVDFFGVNIGYLIALKIYDNARTLILNGCALTFGAWGIYKLAADKDQTYLNVAFAAVALEKAAQLLDNISLYLNTNNDYLASRSALAKLEYKITKRNDDDVHPRL